MHVPETFTSQCFRSFGLLYPAVTFSLKNNMSDDFLWKNNNVCPSILCSVCNCPLSFTLSLYHRLSLQPRREHLQHRLHQVQNQRHGNQHSAVWNHQTSLYRRVHELFGCRLILNVAFVGSCLFSVDIRVAEKKLHSVPFYSVFVLLHTNWSWF